LYLLHIQRLGEHIVNPQLDGRLCVLEIVEAGDTDDDCFGIAYQYFARHRETIPVGHMDIHYDDGRQILFVQVEGFVAVCCFPT
jgi:hypothetical protein